MLKIDLNCDVGESYYDTIIGNDREIIPLISSCNIACGFHGGDPLTIHNAIELALKSDVAVGAHPSFPDLENFGRTYMAMSSEALEACLLYQIGALQSMVRAQGGKLQHVKPHGALYNAAVTDFELALSIAKTIQKIDSSLFLLGMAHSEMEKAAAHVGTRFAAEAFADRSYTAAGSLVSRSSANAVLKDLRMVAARTNRMIVSKEIEAENGTVLKVDSASICVHGDTENAIDLIREIRSECEKNNIQIQSFGNV